MLLEREWHEWWLRKEGEWSGVRLGLSGLLWVGVRLA